MVALRADLSLGQVCRDGDGDDDPVCFLSLQVPRLVHNLEWQGDEGEVREHTLAVGS